MLIRFPPGSCILHWVGIAQWLEHQTCDWKDMGLNPCRSSRSIFLSRLNFLCWLLFQYLFHPCFTAIACKRSRSFCQKCRWQVKAKHACTLHMWLCMKWHGAQLYGVHRTHQDGSSFTWHQPCQCVCACMQACVHACVCVMSCCLASCNLNCWY